MQPILKAVSLSSLMKAIYILSAVAISFLPSLVCAQHVPALEEFSRRVSVAIETQSASGSGVIVGKKGNAYALITAKHVLGGSSLAEDFDVLPVTGPYQGKRYSVTRVVDTPSDLDFAVLVFNAKDSLPLAPVLTQAPDYIRRSEFGPEYNPKGFKHYNPDLEHLRTYSHDLDGINFYRYGQHFHVVGDPTVAGFALPSAAVNRYLFRFSPLKIIDKIKDNADGYNLIYLATSTVPGMSGGGVFGARRCPQRDDWYQDAKRNDTIKSYMVAAYYGVIAVHGRSEAYGSTSGRSGVSLGVPLDSLADFFKANSVKLGIPAGDQYISLVKDLCAKDGGF